MKEYHPQDAWMAYHNQNFDLAGEIWLSLMIRARDISTLTRYQLGYAQILMAKQQYDEALGLLEEVYETTAHPECLRLIEVAAKRSQPEIAARVQSLLAGLSHRTEEVSQMIQFKEAT